jgi:DNA/RNA-binding domain of Phe-tRNA-synthetase-like protein
MSGTDLLAVSPAWYAVHPGATYGLIAFRGVQNPAIHEGINAAAADLERSLRERFPAEERDALRATPPLPAYAAYYKRWGQRYHVGMQLESVAMKAKPIPRVAALVEAMFVSELANLLLTGGHDLDQLSLPVVLDAGAGQEFTAPNDKPQVVKDGDMFTADAEGRVLSAVITGPSGFARISPETTAALFYAYGPPGISADEMSAHLDTIERNVRLISPDAVTVAREIITAP